MAGWKDVINNLKALEKGSVQVGWFENSKYPGGAPVAAGARVQEYGSSRKGIPPRPFMRPAVADNSAGWAAFAGAQFKQAALGQTTAKAIFTLLGTDASGAVKQKISEVNSPALKESTLAARRSRGIATTKPLFATGLMFATCTFKVII